MVLGLGAVSSTAGVVSGTTVTATITTQATSGMLVACIVLNESTNTSATRTVSSTALGSWGAARVDIANASGAQFRLLEFTTSFSSTLTSEVVTFTLGGGPTISFCDLVVFEIPSSTGVDPSVGLPATSTASPSDPIGVSTTIASTFIVGCYRLGVTASPTRGTGWTNIFSASNFCCVEYKIVSAVQAALSVTMTIGAGDSNAGFADAFVVPAQITSDGFISRSSGFGPNRKAAYRALIDGLASDGVWEKFDAFYIDGTIDQTNASLNLVEPRYTLTAHGSPAFVVDQGYTGVDLSNTIYLDTGFVPSTAAANFLRDSAHLGIFVNNNAVGHSGGADAIGVRDSSAVYVTDIAPRFEDGTSILRVNGGAGVVTASTDSTGYWVGTRTASLTTAAYRNGSSLGSNTTDASVGNPPLSLFILSRNSTMGSSDFAGGPYQVAIAHMGGALTATDVTNLYSRIQTFNALLPFGLDLGITAITVDSPMSAEAYATDITGVGQRTIWWRTN